MSLYIGQGGASVIWSRAPNWGRQPVKGKRHAEAAVIAATSFGLTMVAPAVAAADPAVVKKEGYCAGFVPNEDGSQGIGLESHDSRSIANRGGTTLICHFDIPSGYEPSRAARAEGFVCDTYLGTTTDSRMVATPGGRATMTCKIHNNS